MKAAVHAVLVNSVSQKWAAAEHCLPRQTLRRHLNAVDGLGVEKKLRSKDDFNKELEPNCQINYREWKANYMV